MEVKNYTKGFDYEKLIKESFPKQDLIRYTSSYSAYIHYINVVTGYAVIKTKPVVAFNNVKRSLSRALIRISTKQLSPSFKREVITLSELSLIASSIEEIDQIVNRFWAMKSEIKKEAI